MINMGKNLKAQKILFNILLKKKKTTQIFILSYQQVYEQVYFTKFMNKYTLPSFAHL